ncbi:50S ribosomal protein L21 [Candidatus Curtissbacteria bacterium RIFCSPLOWO2_01_FULL_39_62]|uniref:Large ribosomal subunit protein bL21 n=2 Tax=Candidatus Curtissiibacteriota TaxID=1752717 RepID=A0A1F5G846_9BACT|nr:MAG: 50S ribosomal protein L21 [Candidatus Curtissbacteria bacterium RIFCSPHIGHO2_01_FULL_39_57]OGD88031.1 MAG: 50S ribosomal protein L21 [Candidatus Curtissbacteria bacterium RIFCSPHIGHO2_02_FULL_40_16b]OGD91063.1 MAG: 50S ribosomal protein L21 [Candidatus Curtissbacteria bacterium RIFCSPHIGHO2_12_FULL_38_37]OGE00665.1 MAG: 50S ribosomal protein L21 [Candidatus Curtissbacteria bacterium RIFCSPLOWO2_01_FULL_39_62]OGE01551.1 MAG: 50S ribosomal protein L21 [Candidatus Curtissbacteria bacterium
MTNWAIIKSGSKQYKVAEGDKIAVEKLNVNGEKTVNFDEVLLLVKEDKVEVGKPLVEKAKVKAKVLENFREQKVKVVKFKSKSRYLRIQGHRQNKTRVQIEKISAQIPK